MMTKDHGIPPSSETIARLFETPFLFSFSFFELTVSFYLVTTGRMLTMHIPLSLFPVANLLDWRISACREQRLLHPCTSTRDSGTKQVQML